MSKQPEVSAAPKPRSRTSLSARHTVLLALALGLLAGYVDVLVVIFKKYFWYPEHLFGTARDFPWSLPVAHAALMVVPGVLVVLANRLRAGLLSLHMAAWLFTALAFWGGLLRIPAHGAAILALAAGLGRPMSQAIAALAGRPIALRLVSAGLLFPLPLLFGALSVWPRVHESRQLAALPAAPPRAPNVLLVVWDTVRAYNLSAYGYPRETTPHLKAWARNGVRFKRVLATAPWTVPSHSSLFTGRWPFQLDTECRYALEAPVPTLAEYLRSRGYQTAGFAANTSCCSWESGLDRGFVHYEDYPVTPWKLFARTVPGRWLLKTLAAPGDAYARKWLDLESRDAEAVDNAFLAWLDARRRDRPFFAFLNLFDAHMPYISAPGYARRFSPRPKSAVGDQFLEDYAFLDKNKMEAQQIIFARDCYDECIAYMDDQFGRLLNELGRRGLLQDTLVVMASDHGEGFGDHLLFGHGSSVYLDQSWVPLAMAGPGVPTDQVVDGPVSLRDMAATVVDRLGLATDSPLPGRSLAAYWQAGNGEVATSPGLSQHAGLDAFRATPQGGPKREALQISLVDHGKHYLRDGKGVELLYDLHLDPFEETDLLKNGAGLSELDGFRRRMLEILSENRGSATSETAYLKAYRGWLESLVREPSRLSRR
jgi:arylsulfatase A-like enzyme